MKTNHTLTLTLLCLLLTIRFALAQDNSLPFEQKENVVYGEVHGTGLLMDVFTPKTKPNGLGIVDVVSGAYYSDRRKIRDHMLAQVYTVFCQHGYTVFAIRPGSRTRYTGAEMEDHVKLGIRYVKLHAAEYKIDPERLGLTGASAGGHLALLAAVTPDAGKAGNSQPVLQQNTRVKAGAFFFPPTDFLDWDGKRADMNILGELLFLGGAKGRTDEEIEERARQISPARLLTGPTLPLLLIHGDADPLVPLQQSRKMVDAVKAAGGSAELIVKPGGGHPWLTIPQEVEVMAKWFDQRLAETNNPVPSSK